jgi:hypothetical protein
MDETWARRTGIGAVIIVVLGAALAALAFAGGQTSKILSTVGNSVGSGDATNPGDGAGNPAPPATVAPGPGDVAAAGATVPTLLIVRTGTLELTVADLDRAVRDADAAVGRAGGYVSGSDRAAGSGREVATAAYRIPSGAWQPTLDAIRALATTVDVDRVKTDEVTGQVVDLTARIANLRATEAALQTIMAKATKISDVLAVQDQLTTTRGDIERLVGEQAGLVDRASYGSLEVTFRLPVVASPKPTPVPTKGWNPADDVAAAGARLVKVGQTSTSFAIWVAIVGLPIGVAVAIGLVVAWQLYRLGRWVTRRRGGFAGQA